MSGVATGVDLHPPAAGFPFGADAVPRGLAEPSVVASSHSTSPVAGSYDRIRRAPIRTSSVRTRLRQTTGVPQVDFSGRAARHSSSPVRLSNAATNDRPSLSLCTKILSPSIAGELDVPQLANVRNGPRLRDHTGLPDTSKHASTPAMPKYAYTRSPSVMGVSDAYVLDTWLPVVGLRSAATCFHTVAPVAASRQ
jgi:hypothetical protein